MIAPSLLTVLQMRTRLTFLRMEAYGVLWLMSKIASITRDGKSRPSKAAVSVGWLLPFAATAEVLAEALQVNIFLRPALVRTTWVTAYPRPYYSCFAS